MKYGSILPSGPQLLFCSVSGYVAGLLKGLCWPNTFFYCFSVKMFINMSFCIWIKRLNGTIKCWPSIPKEPDVGMPEKDAHKFFQQLISAVVSKNRTL